MSFPRQLFAIATIFMTFAIATASDQERDELRQRAQTMLQEADQLAAKGHKEEAMQLKREARSMMERFEREHRQRPDRRDQEIAEVQHVLDQLRRERAVLESKQGNERELARIRLEVQEMERKLRELHGRERESPNNDIAHRLEHMHAAIQHLEEAGLHDIAKHVNERAEATERELHGHDGHLLHKLTQQLERLTHEVGRLRAEVKELKHEK
ncbi:MAG: hypothetical protein AB8B91_19725 [Rubripirellula sp.]